MARRRIVMRDGKIVEDRRLRPLPRPRSHPRPLPRGGAGGGSAIGLYARQAWRALFANKVRSALSMLGILIGVAAVIAVQAIGDGAKRDLQEQIKRLGANLLLVRPGAAYRAGVSQGFGTAKAKFREADITALAKAVPLISQISGEVSGRVQATSNDKNWNTTVYGVSVPYVSMQDSEPPLGRWFTESERVGRQRVAVVGPSAARRLWGEANPVGETVRLNRVAFSVIGVLPAKGINGNQDQDDRFVVPNATAQFRLFGKEFYDAVVIEIADPDSIPAAQDQVVAFLRARYHLGESKADTFSIRNMSDRLLAAAETAATASLVLKIVAGIALLVGGIGIMNIMLVTVAERTREIGLRKALGAKRRDILSQFLIESVVISLSGGAAGFLLGAGVSLGIGAWVGWAVVVTPASVLVAVGFSSAVGLVFGLWPARQAAQLSPITALRSE